MLDAGAAASAPASTTTAALREFEARLAVVLLEQPSGLELGLLRRRYGRAWPERPNYFPDDPKAFGYRRLGELVRREASRVCRVEDENGRLVLHPVQDRADLERRLLALDVAPAGDGGT